MGMDDMYRAIGGSEPSWYSNRTTAAPNVRTESSGFKTPSAVFGSVDWGDAKALLADPDKMGALYKTQRQYLDADGDGKINKSELIGALTDPLSPPDTRRLANAMFAGYEQLSRLNRYENSWLEALPMNEWFKPKNVDSRPGIGEKEIEALKFGASAGAGTSDAWKEALKTGGLVAAGVGLAFLATKLPRILTQIYVDKVLGEAMLTGTAALKETGMEALKISAFPGLPIALGSGLIAGTGRITNEMGKHNYESTVVSEMVEHLKQSRS
jgi:hypothetical protein